MERIEVIVMGTVEMLFAAYGDDAIKMLHRYLDTHHPETGIDNGGRDRRHDWVRANNQMYLVNYVRNAGGREVNRGEMEQALGYTNPDHLSYDLRKVRERDELRKCSRRGFYRLGKRYDS